MPGLRENIGYILAVLVLSLVFTCSGILLAPSIAPLLILLFWLDLVLLGVVFAAMILAEIRDRLQS